MNVHVMADCICSLFQSLSTAYVSAYLTYKCLRLALPQKQPRKVTLTELHVVAQAFLPSAYPQ